MTIRSMVRHYSTPRSALIGALVFVFGIAPSALCLAAAAQLPEAPHPCCAGMTDDCPGSMTTQTDCCAIQNADLVRFGSVAKVVAMSVPVVTGSVVAESTPVASAPPVAAFDPGVPKPASPPLYLLVSLFRI